MRIYKTERRTSTRGRLTAWWSLYRSRLVLLAALALCFMLPGSAGAVATITGVAGTTINAVVSAPSAGDLITGSSIQTPMQSVVNDLATISTGNVTIAGNKTFTGTDVIASTLHVANAATLDAQSGGTIAARSGSLLSADSGSMVNLYGLIRLPATTVLADRASGTAYLIGVGDVGNILLVHSQSIGFTIKLRITTAPAPTDGDWIRIVIAESAASNGNAINIMNEGASAQFMTLVKGTVDVRYSASAGKWQLIGFGAPDANMSFGTAGSPPEPY